jgi:hypothetical protein
MAAAAQKTERKVRVWWGICNRCKREVHGRRTTRAWVDVARTDGIAIVGARGSLHIVPRPRKTESLIVRIPFKKVCDFR